MANLNSSFNLFIKAQEIPYISGEIPLFIDGCSSGTSGLFKNIDLFIAGTSILTSNLNLFVKNFGPESKITQTNLYIGGQGYYFNDNIPLFINNSGTEVNIPLYIRGSGITAGTIPYYSNMNLFIRRDEANGISLFLQGPGTQVTGVIPLVLTGAYINTSGIDFSLPNTKGLGSGVLTLNVHGF